MWENCAWYYHSFNDTHLEKLHGQIYNKNRHFAVSDSLRNQLNFVISISVN